MFVCVVCCSLFGFVLLRCVALRLRCVALRCGVVWCGVVWRGGLRFAVCGLRFAVCGLCDCVCLLLWFAFDLPLLCLLCLFDLLLMRL